jgi:MurNAc alpha-1-phosphate uridylyltransferase
VVGRGSAILTKSFLSKTKRLATLHPMADLPPNFKAPAQAMLLAAGRGERMRPLTDTTPKPLLKVHQKPLLWYPLKGLTAGGVDRVLINTAWLGAQFSDYFGEQFVAPDHKTVNLSYSHEGLDFGGALETAGGIVRALPQLADVFWVAAGDIYAPEFEFSAEAYERFTASPQLAHIWLVPNPAHNPGGDFGLSASGFALNLPKSAVLPGPAAPNSPAVQALGHQPVPHAAHSPRYTFSTIALYKRAFFEAAWCPIPAGNPEGVKAPLAAMLRAAMEKGLVSASLYEGMWVDVGTPERLAQLNA